MFNACISFNAKFGGSEGLSLEEGYIIFKETLCRNFSHLVVKFYEVLSSALLFQMCVGTWLQLR
jgi:hypothetical protein